MVIGGGHIVKNTQTFNVHPPINQTIICENEWLENEEGMPARTSLHGVVINLRSGCLVSNLLSAYQILLAVLDVDALGQGGVGGAYLTALEVVDEGIAYLILLGD